jgi:hypothetical protein
MSAYNNSCTVEFERLIDSITEIEDESFSLYHGFCTIHFEEIAKAFINEID